MLAKTLGTCVAAALTAVVCAWPSIASANTLLTDFDNYSLYTETYGSWAGATITAGPTSLNVQAQNGFGGQWNDLDPNVDATGETHIEMIVKVNVADETTGLGVVFALVDEDGTEWQYVINSAENSWFGLLPGPDSYVLTVPINGATGLINPGTAGGLDLANLTGFHLQVDTGGDADPYDISFENFRMFVPGEDIDGDLNGDGFVGLADLDIVLGNWNANVTPGSLSEGDPSGDGFVGLADLDTVLGNWNAGTPPAAGAAVPEPTTLALLGIGALAAMKRRD